jgi:hypothetical protein
MDAQDLFPHQKKVHQMNQQKIVTILTDVLASQETTAPEIVLS